MPRVPFPAGVTPPLALLGAALAALAPFTAPSRAEDPADLAAARRAAGEMRRIFGAGDAPVEDSWQELTYLGRSSLEIKGRVPGADGVSRMQDYAVFDLGTARMVTFVWFPHASTRKAGEPILPISEVSARADALLRGLAPPRPLALESVERYRASGQESVYYEVRYAAPEEEIRFLRPPVRLLIDASTGALFRYDLDPAWIAPPAPPPPRARLSRQAAERIAAAALRGRDLGGAFGPGAVPGKPAALDLFYVRPNGWLGFGEAAGADAPQVAWVVSVPVIAPGQAGPRSFLLFVDAAGGRLLGGEAGPGP